MSASSLNPEYEKIKKNDTLYIKLKGEWLTRSLNTIEAKISLSEEELQHAQQVYIEFADNFKADTAGSWMVASLLKKLKNKNIPFKIDNHPQYIDELMEKDFAIAPPEEQKGWRLLIEKLGKAIVEMSQTARELTSFLGEVLVTIYRNAAHLKFLRVVSLVHHLQIVGFQALPIISLISFLIGAVLAYQGIVQLEKFGASIYTIDFLGIALVRELSVLLTSIVVAGRSGSAFTAQIGTMALNQEIDAIRVLGLNPIIVLVVPRLLALLIALPILVVVSMLAGCIGGMCLTSLLIDVSAGQFWHSLQKAVQPTTFWVGMSKAPLFALIIGIVGCFRGLQVKGSAESIGLMTTRSVVEGIFLVIVCDALMSIVYSSMGI